MIIFAETLIAVPSTLHVSGVSVLSMQENGESFVKLMTNYLVKFIVNGRH